MKTDSTYHIKRTDNGVVASLKCQECGAWFDVPADDSLFAVLLVKVAPRFNCGKHFDEVPTNGEKENHN